MGRARQYRHRQPLYYRLRFVLNVPGHRQTEEIEQLRMVKDASLTPASSVVHHGTGVGDYYRRLLATTGQTSADKEAGQAGRAAKYEGGMNS